MFKSGVYKITNKINNHCYVGSSLNVQRRLNEHKIGRRSNKHLQSAIKKYGIENFAFEVFDYVSKPENLVKYEQLWIDSIKPDYNLSPTAGNSLGVKRSEEFKQKIRNYRIGKTHSVEVKKKISESEKRTKRTSRGII